MDIKEVIERIEKAFPAYKVSNITKAHTTDDIYGRCEAWQIAIYKPNIDTKK